ncbi:feruloyl-CoA synthase [Sulfitobacter sp. LCG007]
MTDDITGLRMRAHAVAMRRDGGDIFLTSRVPLDKVARRTLDWLHHWASEAPERVFLAERAGEGWREATYAQTLQSVRAVASALIARDFGADTPVVILSGNSIDHALLSLGAQYAGVPTVPLAEQYSLVPEAHCRLAYVVGKVRPAMVFASDAARFSGALALPLFDGVEIVASRPEGAPRRASPFATLLEQTVTPRTDARLDEVGPDTVAKILFTSGSSSDPKGVLTTQGMMCANQAQIASVLPFLKDRPPRICDWLPWNHVFGGSHNTNMVLANGGTLTIDEGKPVAALFDASIRNNTERPGTLAFNVPVGFSLLVQEMRVNTALRNAYFRDLDLVFYAGASLPQDVWTALEDMSREVRGRVPLMISSWGMTETAPATLMVHEPIGRSGVVGVPMPETEIRLIPDADMRCELRVKGPNVMPGYFEDAARSQAAFDAEGFLITGDAVRFVDEGDPDRGLIFDGRIGEDFKLLTGTWVQAGTLRIAALETLRGLVQDVVICGHDRDAVGLFVFPRPDQIARAHRSGGALVDPPLQARIEERLRDMARAATGSAKRIERALILAEPPSLKHGEITDKGSLNVARIVARRADLLERLYDNEDPALIRV